MSPETAVYLKRLVSAAVLPPYGLVLFATLALLWAVVSRKRSRLPVVLALLALLSFFVLTSPPGARWLVQMVEHKAGPALEKTALVRLMRSDSPPAAIVVLGGGLVSDEREQPYVDRPTPQALERVLGAARIARWADLPILTSGGAPRDRELSEAQVMARILTQDLGLPVRWTESDSLDTADNAVMSTGILKEQGIGHIVLVTHALHIPRARQAFEAAGMTVTAAPIGFLGGRGVAPPATLLPNGRSVGQASYALHELFGMGWYALRRTMKRSSSQ